MPTLAQKYENNKQDINALTTTDLALTSTPPLMDASASNVAKKAALSKLISVFAPAQGRLTLEENVPYSRDNQTAKTSIYWTPYKGNNLALYDGTRWNLRQYTSSVSNYMTIKLTNSGLCTTTNGSPVVTTNNSGPPTPWYASQLIIGMKVTGTGIPASTTIVSIDAYNQITLNNNATADGTNTLTFKVPGSGVYDVVGYDYGTPAYAHITMIKWTNDTTRANNLTTQDGVYCLTNSHNIIGITYTGAQLRYLGTIRTTNNTDGECEDSYTWRFVFNMYNRLRRVGFTYNSNTSWTYNTAGWREANGGTGQVRFNCVVGMPTEIRSTYNCWVVHATSGSYAGAAVDSTTGTIMWDMLGFSSELSNGYYNANVRYILTAGYHYCTQVEYSSATGTATYYGQGSSTSNGYSGSMFILEM